MPQLLIRLSPTITYTERNDSLGLCVIQDILTFAFYDDAFDSPYIKSPRDLWRFTDVPEHRLSTPIHFKKASGKSVSLEILCETRHRELL